MKKQFQKIGVILLTMLILLNTLLSSLGSIIPDASKYNTSVVHADSPVVSDAQTVQNFYLNALSGVKMESLTKDGQMDQFTTNDFRVLSIFLSNFYVPFGTCIDGVDDSSSMFQSQMSVLQQMGMDDDVASAIINACYKYSKGTATQLFVSTEDLKKVSVKSGDGHRFSANYADFTIGGYANSNQIYTTVENLTTNDNYNTLVGAPITQGDTTYIPVTLFIWWGIINYFNTHNDDTTTLELYCYDSVDNKITSTPALTMNSAWATAYGLLIKHIEASKGYCGNAILQKSLTDSTAFTDVDTLATFCEFTQKVYVDWVGNIICDFGSYRAIICPSVSNDRTFVYQSGSGSTATMYPMLTAMSIPYFLRTSLNYNLETQKYNVFEKETANVWTTYRGSSDKFDDWKYMSGATSDKTRGNGESFKSWAKTWGFAHDLGEKVGKKDSVNKTYTVILGDENNATSPTCFEPNNIHNQYMTFYTNGQYGTSTAYMKREEAKEIFSPMAASYSIQDSNSKDYSSYTTVSTDNSAAIPWLVSFLLTYTVAYLNNPSIVESMDNVPHLSYRFNVGAFPMNENSYMDWNSATYTEDTITSWIYELLHPDSGTGFIKKWFKTKISAILLGIHTDIVGGTDSNVSFGATEYVGFSGYVTTPTLHDIDWLDSFLDYYNLIVIYLLILMAIITLCYVLTNQLSLSRGFAGLLLFGVLLFIPPFAINSIITVSNNISDSLYSKKFDYWAYVQLQGYLPSLVSNLGDDSKTGVTSYVESGLTDHNNGATYQGIKVKWMMPKRFNEFGMLYDELKSDVADNGLPGVANLIFSGVKALDDTEAVLHSDSATYIYRDYLNIYDYASTFYSITSLCGFNYKNTGYSWYANTRSPLKQWSNSGLDHMGLQYSSGLYLKHFVNSEANKDGIETVHMDGNVYNDTSSIKALQRGFIYPTLTNKAYKKNYFLPNRNNASLLLLSNTEPIGLLQKNKTKLLNDIKSNAINVSATNVAQNKFVYGIAQDKFKLTVGNVHTAKETILDDLSQDVNSFTKEDIPYAYYSLYSESPFYYFNFNVRDQVNSTFASTEHGCGDVGNANESLYLYDSDKLGATDNSYGHIRTLLLANNQMFFYNLQESSSGDGYGELRDFMNLHDFFYYILPILQTGNDVVDLWTSNFGMFMYEDSGVSVTGAGYLSYNGEEYATMQDLFKSDDVAALDQDDLYKLWHDCNTIQVFNCYTGWLYTMNDCTYAEPETIHVSGHKFEVANPLDPTTYFECDSNGNITDGRYMVFSRSEMKYYGLNFTDLTRVEQKCIEVQDAVYQKSINLLNYYTLSDEVLIQALSMLETFEFNRIFSESNFVTSDKILYPQSYELKAVTYDAYMRMILSESANESLMANADEDGTNNSIYERILKKTSIFFAIFLILNDIVAVYIYPALKLFFIVAIFIVSVLLLISATFNIHKEGQVSIVALVTKSIIQPLLLFLCLNVALAFVVSLFMTSGMQQVTKTTATISLGDPTVACIAMLAVNTAVIILMFKLCRKCFMDLISYFRVVFSSIAGAVTGALHSMGMVLGGAHHNKGDNYDGSASSDVSQRGKNNLPTSKTGANRVSRGAGLGLAGVAAGTYMANKMSQKYKADGTANGEANGSASGKSTNKYDKVSAEGKFKPVEAESSSDVKQKFEEAHGGESAKEGKAKGGKAYSKIQGATNDKKVNAASAKFDKASAEAASATNTYASMMSKKKEKYANSQTGKYDASKKALKTEAGAFKNHLNDVKSKKGSEKGVAIASTISSGGKQIKNAASYAAHGIASAPKRGAKAVARKMGYTEDSALYGFTHSKEIKAKKASQEANAKLGSARKELNSALESNRDAKKSSGSKKNRHRNKGGAHKGKKR